MEQYEKCIQKFHKKLMKTWTHVNKNSASDKFYPIACIVQQNLKSNFTEMVGLFIPIKKKTFKGKFVKLFQLEKWNKKMVKTFTVHL